MTEMEGVTINEDAVVQVLFFTHDVKYMVSKTPYSLPLTTSTENLDSLIKTIILEETSDKDISDLTFDFLINSELIRESLFNFIKTKNLSTESVLEIEYTKKLQSPDPQKAFVHKDWVSCVDSFYYENISETFFATGCYDNSVNVWTYTGKGEQVLTKIIHEGPIKDIKLVSQLYNKPLIASKNVSFQFLTASHDQTIKLWKVERQIKKPNKKNKEGGEINVNEGNHWILQCLSIFRGHSNSVECLGIKPMTGNNNQGLFCSGSWDKMIKIWSYKDDETIRTNDQKSKKTKLPILTLANHDDVVSALQWITENEICSASWDHKIKIWDIEAQKIKSTLAGQKALLSISYSPLSQLIISGSTDNYIRLWDPRSEVGTIVKATFPSHKNWVSSVKWSPNNTNLFASGSYDSIVKIWDMRSTTSPLYNLYGQKEKVLCTEWTGSDLVISGGSDKTLQIFKLFV